MDIFIPSRHEDEVFMEQRMSEKLREKSGDII